MSYINNENDLEVGSNIKKANDLLIELVLEPLNKILQESDMYLQDFSYYNHRANLLAVGVSEKYLCKITSVSSDNDNTSFHAVKVEIFNKQIMMKIDEQILYFDKEFLAIKRNRRSLNTLNTEQDMTSTVYKLSSYIEKWIVVFQEIEDKNNILYENSSSEQLKLGFDE